VSTYRKLKKRGRIILGRRRLMPPDESVQPPAPFVCGVTRSGTTLIRLMLDSHPDMAIPGETHWVPKLIRKLEHNRLSPEEVAEYVIESKRWQEFHLDPDLLRERYSHMKRGNATEAIRAFYKLYAEREGKTRYGDKTPGYIKDMVRIQRSLPEATFIHIIRDGRDVSLSHMRMNWGPTTYAESAQLWVDRIYKARRMSKNVARYHEVHFEDLVRDTEGTLREVCEIIELDYEPVMLDYHERAEERLEEKNVDLVRRHGPTQPAAARMESHKLAKEPPREDRLNAWKHKMTEEEVASYEAIAGPMLVELGYELSG
jgi:hypothetical protein